MCGFVLKAKETQKDIGFYYVILLIPSMEISAYGDISLETRARKKIIMGHKWKQITQELSTHLFCRRPVAQRFKVEQGKAFWINKLGMLTFLRRLSEASAVHRQGTSASSALDWYLPSYRLNTTPYRICSTCTPSSPPLNDVENLAERPCHLGGAETRSQSLTSTTLAYMIFISVMMYSIREVSRRASE